MTYTKFPRRTGVHFFSLGLLVAFLLFNSGFAFALPRADAPAAIDPTVPTLRVMSWNAYFLNKEPAAFFAEVEKLQPDVIALQELSTLFTDAILEHLQDDYPYMELYPSKIPAGSAILSRYPFQSTTVPDYDEWHGCNCQIVTVQLENEVVTLINAHPWPPKVSLGGTGDLFNLFALDTTTQDPIFNQLLNRIAGATSPLLVVGDFNTMPFQPNIQRMTAQLHDTFGEVGSGAGYTFPAQATDHGLPPRPFMRIDYIFHDDAWTATGAWNGTISGSDHRYLVADLLLQP
ncbi:MAG: endonuclease/exonuclease/phosphatase family protein [Caldilineaceae bacterium]|nr:endonuclease/exonuclease/phosphatase family protein [Caldilineaceae bacterium]